MRARFSLVTISSWWVVVVSLGLAAVGGWLERSYPAFGAAVIVLALACAYFTLTSLSRASTEDPVTPWDRVRREIERARRYDGSLVVVRLRLVPSAGTLGRPASSVAQSVLRET